MLQTHTLPAARTSVQKEKEEAKEKAHKSKSQTLESPDKGPTLSDSKTDSAANPLADAGGAPRGPVIRQDSLVQNNMGSQTGDSPGPKSPPEDILSNALSPVTAKTSGVAPSDAPADDKKEGVRLP